MTLNDQRFACCFQFELMGPPQDQMETGDHILAKSWIRDELYVNKNVDRSGTLCRMNSDACLFPPETPGGTHSYDEFIGNFRIQENPWQVDRYQFVSSNMAGMDMPEPAMEVSKYSWENCRTQWGHFRARFDAHSESGVFA